MNDRIPTWLTKRPLLSLAAGSGVGVLAIAVRICASGSPRLGFLVWNLFLAWIPALASLALPKVSRFVRRPLARRPLEASIFLGWLAFLPNAPYLVTDGVHLCGHHHGIVGILDGCILGICGFLGIALGVFALRSVLTTVGFAPDSVRGRWLGAVFILLSGYGIYLGRTLRLNSWDAFTHPSVLALRPHLDPAFVAWSLLATLAFALAFRHLPRVAPWGIRRLSNVLSLLRRPQS